MTVSSTLLKSLMLVGVLASSANSFALEANRASIDIDSSVTSMVVQISNGSGGCLAGQQWDIQVGRCTAPLVIGTGRTTNTRTTSCPAPQTGSMSQSQSCTRNINGWRIPPSGAQVINGYGAWSCGSWVTTNSQNCKDPVGGGESGGGGGGSGTTFAVTAFICGSSNSGFYSGVASAANKNKMISNYRAFSYGRRCPELGGFMWWQATWSAEAQRKKDENPSLTMAQAWDAAWPRINTDMFDAARINGEHLPSYASVLNGFCTDTARSKGFMGGATYISGSGDQCRVL